MKNRLTFYEAAQLIGIDEKIVVEMIEREWISPVSEQDLDHEDVARVRLIVDLRIQFGVNDEAVPIILHLVDQLCDVRNTLSAVKYGDKK